MTELPGLDASLLALIADYAPLDEVELQPLLDKLTDENARRLAKLLATGPDLPPNVDPQDRDFVEHLRGWARRNREVHAPAKLSSR